MNIIFKGLTLEVVYMNSLARHLTILVEGNPNDDVIAEKNNCLKSNKSVRYKISNVNKQV